GIAVRPRGSGAAHQPPDRKADPGDHTSRTGRATGRRPGSTAEPIAIPIGTIGPTVGRSAKTTADPTRRLQRRTVPAAGPDPGTAGCPGGDRAQGSGTNRKTGRREQSPRKRRTTGGGGRPPTQPVGSAIRAVRTAVATRGRTTSVP